MPTLPLTITPKTQIRILVRNQWSDDLGDWQELPYYSQARGGYLLEDCSRTSLPAVGEARLVYEFGRFVGRGGVQVVGADQSGADGWNPDTDSITAQDLTDYVVLIQGVESNLPRAQIADTDWNDLYLGAVEYWQDQLVPGAAIPDGRRIYYLVDLWTHYSRRWVNTHYTYAAPTDADRQVYLRVQGPPKYNDQPRGLGYVLGNYSTGAFDYYAPLFAVSADEWIRAHAQTGTADTRAWTDAEVIQHQINNCRGPGDPWIQFQDSVPSGTGNKLYDQASVWTVDEGESVFSVVSAIADRRRGKGVVLFEWVRSGSSFTELRLRAYPQTLDDIEYVDVDDNAVRVPGADTNGTTVTYDLIGDHRIVDESFRLGQRHMTQCDYLETVGEHIEILVTLSYEDSTLAEGWDTDTYQTEFNAATAEERRGTQYGAVYHLHRLPRDWDGKAAGGAGEAATPVFWRCDDDGNLTTGFGSSQDFQLASSSGSAYEMDAAIDRIQIERDLPIVEGYDYTTTTPVRYDGDPETGTPRRRPIMTFLREADTDTFTDLQTVQSPTISVTPDGLYMTFSADQQQGVRTVGDTAESIGSTYDYTDLGYTVALRMPHRVRIASAATETGAQSARRKRIYVPGIRLHLAHEQAIWQIDGDKTVYRACAGASAALPGILRDDRNRLARIHNVAAQWYLVDRQNVSWSLRACGLLPSFEALQDTGNAVPPPDNPSYQTPATATVVYPIVGEVISTLGASGQQNVINCPVTRVRYDHTTGITSWTCDWVELDFRRV